MRYSKLENIEAIGLLSIIMANKIILNIPKSIIMKTGTSAWINIIYISIIAVLFIIFINKLFNNFPSSDILDISDYLGKKILKIPIGIIYILFLILTTTFILRNFTESLKIIYFNQSPLLFLLFFFITVACISNEFGIKTISKTVLIIMPVVLLTILFIMFSSFHSFVPQRLFPIFGYGIKETFINGATNIFSYSGLAYLFFLRPLLKNEQDFQKISIISTIISGIYLLLSIVCLLTSFSFILDTNENISIYLLSKMAKYGDFFQRANAIFIFIWILSVLSYICISLYFIIYITKKLFHVKNISTINYSYCSIILSGALIMQNFAQYLSFFESIFRASILILLFGINTLILILANIKYKLRNQS